MTAPTGWREPHATSPRYVRGFLYCKLFSSNIKMTLQYSIGIQMQSDTMEKKKFSSRLQLLNDGRSHYLNYLRNITPQTVLLSIVVVMLQRADFSDPFAVIIFVFLFGGFCLAAYANWSLFKDECFSDLILWVHENNKSLRRSGIKGRSLFLAKIKSIWKEKFVECLEMALVVWFFQIVLALVIVVAVYSAMNMLKFHSS
ncbi:hypothetical protein [Laribacter hongkongensis]|uniref:hypothetical protein n=2 Tax=Laribacter hongkongensis TaxID=168471 RepID=UPI0011802BE8|nr:hypothetical protein [Laribacter hongkongensis]